MRIRIKLLKMLAVSILLFFITSCSNEKAGENAEKDSAKQKQNEVMINAGAGLKPALDVINASFTEKYGTKVIGQYMCSAMVLANLLLARETDVFFPGSEFFMNKAIEEDAIVKPEGEFPGVYMIPAITTPKGNPKNITTLEDLAKPGIKVGLGDFKTLAVGRLTEKMLKEQGIYEEVKKNHVFNAPSATKLQLNVSLGSVDAAINWKSIILMHEDMSDYTDIPVEQLKYSVAPLGLATFSKNPELAQTYIDYIKSPEGQKIFRENGYTLPEGADKIERIQ